MGAGPHGSFGFARAFFHGVLTERQGVGRAGEQRVRIDGEAGALIVPGEREGLRRRKRGGLLYAVPVHRAAEGDHERVGEPVVAVVRDRDRLSDRRGHRREEAVIGEGEKRVGHRDRRLQRAEALGRDRHRISAWAGQRVEVVEAVAELLRVVAVLVEQRVVRVRSVRASVNGDGGAVDGLDVFKTPAGQLLCSVLQPEGQGVDADGRQSWRVEFISILMRNNAH